MHFHGDFDRPDTETCEIKQVSSINICLTLGTTYEITVEDPFKRRKTAIFWCCNVQFDTNCFKKLCLGKSVVFKLDNEVLSNP